MAISGSDGSIILTTDVDQKGLNSSMALMKTQFTKLSSFATKAFMAISAAAAVATVAITKQATQAYGEYEQLVGGVETLFKDSAKQVIQYAEEAYRTAGVSSNQYMQTVTSFSASLLSSLGGDTAKSAEVANMALIDMSDNANKMGTALETVQTAYQGFAKQQYMLLDNLKLGYGGTKTEMERLLKDATAISGVKYDISNLADVYNAIHVIQTELGITGTTAKEAATTLQGSAGMMKASWQNLLTAFGGGGDLNTALENFVDSFGTYMDNLLPIVERVLVNIGYAIERIAPMLVERVASAVIQAIPSLVASVWNMIVGLGKGIVSGFQALFSGNTKEGAKELTDSMSDLSTSTEKTANNVDNVAESTKKAGKEAKKALASFDKLNVVQSTSGSEGGGADSSVGSANSNAKAVSSTLADLDKTSKGLSNSLMQLIKKPLNQLKKAFAPLAKINLKPLVNSFKGLVP